MTKITDLHRRWRKDADYKGALDALGEEFDLARALRGASQVGEESVDLERRRIWRYAPVATYRLKRKV